LIFWDLDFYLEISISLKAAKTATSLFVIPIPHCSNYYFGSNYFSTKSTHVCRFLTGYTISTDWSLVCSVLNGFNEVVVNLMKWVKPTRTKHQSTFIAAI